MLAVSVRPMQIGRMLAGEQAATLASPVLRHSPSRLPRKPESLAGRAPSGDTRARGKAPAGCRLRLGPTPTGQRPPEGLAADHAHQSGR